MAWFWSNALSWSVLPLLCLGPDAFFLFSLLLQLFFVIIPVDPVDRLLIPPNCYCPCKCATHRASATSKSLCLINVPGQHHPLSLPLPVCEDTDNLSRSNGRADSRHCYHHLRSPSISLHPFLQTTHVHFIYTSQPFGRKGLRIMAGHLSGKDTMSENHTFTPTPRTP